MQNAIWKTMERFEKRVGGKSSGGTGGGKGNKGTGTLAWPVQKPSFQKYGDKGGDKGKGKQKGKGKKGQQKGAGNWW